MGQRHVGRATWVLAVVVPVALSLTIALALRSWLDRNPAPKEAPGAEAPATASANELAADGPLDLRIYCVPDLSADRPNAHLMQGATSGGARYACKHGGGLTFRYTNLRAGISHLVIFGRGPGDHITWMVPRNAEGAGVRIESGVKDAELPLVFPLHERIVEGEIEVVAVFSAGSRDARNIAAAASAGTTPELHVQTEKVRIGRLPSP